MLCLAEQDVDRGALPNETSWVTIRASAGHLRRLPAAPRGTKALRPAKTAVAPEVRRRLSWLVSVLGNNRVAELLQVSRSQPSRWRTGKEGLAVESRRAVIDLDYIVTRLQEVYVPEVARIWLTSPNAFLGGGTPVEALRQRGVLDVIAAIDAEAAGAYV